MRACLLELRPALGIDQGRRRIGKMAFGIAAGGMSLRLDEDRPARAQPAKRVVEPAGGGDELGWYRGIEVRTAKPRGALEAAVLVEDDAFVDQRRPGQEIGRAA